MENEEVVGLLREIRDLQKLHVENYKEALENQEQSIAVQKNAALLQRRMVIVLLTIVGVAVAVAVMLSLWHK